MRNKVCGHGGTESNYREEPENGIFYILENCFVNNWNKGNKGIVSTV